MSRWGEGREKGAASWSRRRAISPTVTAHLLRCSASSSHLLILSVCVGARRRSSIGHRYTLTAAPAAAAEIHLRLQRVAAAAADRKKVCLFQILKMNLAH